MPPGGWAAFPQFPLDWFKGVAGVEHSWAIWPQPWHLKHWRELGSLLLAVPSHLALVPWLFCPWCLLIVVLVLWPVGVLQSRAICSSLVQLLWELGHPGVPLSVCPFPQPLSGDIWGTGWAATLPCPGQGSNQFGNLLPQFFGTLSRVFGHGSPSPYLVLDCLVLTFCLVGDVLCGCNEESSRFDLKHFILLIL